MKTLIFIFAVLLPFAYVANLEAAYVLDVTVKDYNGNLEDTVIVRAIDASGDTAFYDTTAFTTSGHAYLSGLLVDTVYTIYATKLGKANQSAVFEMEAAYTDSAKLTIIMEPINFIVNEGLGLIIGAQQTYVASAICSFMTTGGSLLHLDTTDSYGRAFFDYTVAAATKYKCVLAKTGYPAQTNFFSTDNNTGWGHWTVRYQASPTATTYDYTGTCVTIAGQPASGISIEFRITGPKVVPDSGGAGTYYVPVGSSVSAETNASGLFTLTLVGGIWGDLYINGVYWDSDRVIANRAIGAIGVR